MQTRASWSGHLGSVVALILVLALAVSAESAFAWDPGGTRVTFQPGTQSNPLALPSGTIVYSDSEGVGIWVSMAQPAWSPWYAPVIRYVSQPVSQLGGISHPPRAIDFLDYSVLIAWSHDHDGRDDADIFVRRIGHGGPDPSFGQDGVLVCGADSAQTDPCLIGDGADGFYVAWSDRRNAGDGADIYIQRFDAHGGVRPGWPADGIRLCGASGDQLEPALFADSSGGAVAVWRDLRSGTSDLYAKGIDSTGVSSAGWGAGGLPVCTAEGEQDHHVVLPDGTGGAYVAWRDNRIGIELPFVTRIRKDGANEWRTDGVLASTNPGQEAISLSMCPAESGGVFLAWNWITSTLASGTSVQRLGPDGGLRWYDPGVQVGTGASFGSGAQLRTAPAVMPDGAGGVFVSWSAGTPVATDLRASRLDGAGSLREFWPQGGIVVNDAAGDQLLPEWRSGGSPGSPLVPDGHGGFIVIWTDTRAADDADLYAQRVTKNGVVAPESPTFCFEYCGPPDYIRAVYPNPTRGDVVARVWVPEDRSVTIDIYDVQGRHRATQRSGRQPGGTVMEIPVTLRGVPTGVYFLRYRLEEAPPDISFGTRRVVLFR